MNAGPLLEAYRARVLVCEDEGLTVMQLRKALQMADYAVVGVTADAMEALAMAEALRPDVILMDIDLSGAMNGIEATRALCQRTPAAVVMLTAYDGAEYLQAAFAAGACAYVVKPVTSALLLSVVEAVLQRLQHLREHLNALGEGQTHAVVYEASAPAPQTRPSADDTRR